MSKEKKQEYIKTINNLMGALATLDMNRFNLMIIANLVQGAELELDTEKLHTMISELTNYINELQKEARNESEANKKNDGQENCKPSNEQNESAE